MPSNPSDGPIANPTYLGNIRGFFDDGEIACMNQQGIDLSSYDSVRHHATDIYEQTKAGNMPMGRTPWTAARVQTFLNWIKTGFPMGVAPKPTPPPSGGGGNDPVVAHPTYMADIRHFFRASDIACMRGQGVNLGTYAGVRASAANIYQQTKSGAMPMGGPAWSANRVQTFQNWINGGFVLGAAAPAHLNSLAAPIALPDTVRLRKNVTALSQPEIDLLKKAFAGIIALDPKQAGDKVDPNSYFGLAALHGLPNAYCMHHVDTYNPWHRVYMRTFEDALRSVSGCENVTLPYWDITEPVPPLLSDPPFANYTLPVDIGDPTNYPAGYVTQRYDPATIQQNLLTAPSVPSDISEALPSSLWGAYNGGGFEQFIIAAHDDGHDSCGPTMSDQDVAAYDPIFWFFHCNWDRLWESWQVLVGGTTVSGFTSTLAGDTDWLALGLDPWTQTSDDTIPWPDTAYDQLAGQGTQMHPPIAGQALAANAFRLAATPRVSLRVKDIDRMNIPGTFVVWLLADGERIARRAFFQPRSPRTCATCQKLALVSVDFQLDQSLIAGKQLSISIVVPSLGSGDKAILPLAEAGNPTINVRLLLTED
ncbi:MAG TPA: tyrosinase family protein [Caulobacteraceae bacterium]